MEAGEKIAAKPRGCCAVVGAGCCGAMAWLAGGGVLGVGGCCA